MKKRIEIMKLIGIYGKKSSTLGNPSYGVEFIKGDGEYLTGRTASNASVGYWLCDSHIGKTVTVSYHFTAKGNCIIDTIRD